MNHQPNDVGQADQSKKKPRKRGLASADQATRFRVAQLGGEAVSQDRKHMADIGRKGGEASHRSNTRDQQNNERHERA